MIASMMSSRTMAQESSRSRLAITCGPSGGRPPPMVSSVSYPPGHEYVVPASMSVADAGCEPGHGEGDGGSLACEMDAANSSQ